MKLVVSTDKVAGSSIILAAEAQTSKYATQEAYIIDIGPQAWKAYGDGEPWAKIGDKVLIIKYSGQDRHDLEQGEIYRVINDEDVLSIFEGEELHE